MGLEPMTSAIPVQCSAPVGCRAEHCTGIAEVMGLVYLLVFILNLISTIFSSKELTRQLEHKSINT